VPPRWRFRFRLHEAIHGGGRRSRLPVVQKDCRFCQREAVRGGGWRSRLPVVQKAAGSACAKRFTAAAGAAGFPLLKRLPVSAARSDSRRRLAQQASHC